MNIIIIMISLGGCTLHLYLVKFYDEFDEEFLFALENEATYLIGNIEYLGMPVYRN